MADNTIKTGYDISELPKEPATPGGGPEVQVDPVVDNKEQLKEEGRVEEAARVYPTSTDPDLVEVRESNES